MATLTLKRTEWRTFEAAGHTVPFIAAVIDPGDGTPDDASAFIANIINNALGYTVGCALIANTRFAPVGMVSWFENGSVTWGTSTGNKITIQNSKSGNFLYSRIYFYYNDVKIIELRPRGVYDQNYYHITPLIIPVDENGKIYEWNSYNLACLMSNQIEFSYEPGFGVWTIHLNGDWRIASSIALSSSQPIQNVDIDDISKKVSLDPYGGAGDSQTYDPHGTFDYSGNPPGGFDDFEFPSISAVDTGFVTLYNPTAQQLKQLSDYLWSNSFDLNTFKKLFNDPMELFLGLSIVPVPVPDGGTREVGVGLISTGIFMTVAASQWVSVDCGAIDVPLFSDSYLDFDPYTTIEIYLPYIGTRTLKADEVMGHNLAIHYAVDILSGACVAWLDIDGHVTYCYMGQCATSIPIVSGDWTNLINGILSVVGGAVGGAVKGGVGGAIAGGVAAASSVAVTDGKISVERSGSISSAGGLLAPQKPFLIISSPRICKPADQYLFEGYPAYVTILLSELSGFTQVENIQLQGISGTDAEISEIESLLISGVIL